MDKKIINKFDFDKYTKNIIEKFTKKTLNKQNEEIFKDILLDDYIQKNIDIIKKSKKIKQIQMKIGLLWQIAIGEYIDFTDLEQGHESGLDILSESKKIIIELKNRYNTDNKSSKLSNYDKLSKYKKSHNDYKCIYGIINCNSKNGKHEKIIHNGVEIEYYSGDSFLSFIFEDNKTKIIKILKEIINIYISST